MRMGKGQLQRVSLFVEVLFKLILREKFWISAKCCTNLPLLVGLFFENINEMLRQCFDRADRDTLRSEKLSFYP